MWVKMLVCTVGMALLAVAGCDTRSEMDTVRTRAEQGDAKAQYDLGLRYYNTRGETRSFVEAYKWFYLAGVAEHTNPSPACIKLAKEMTAAQIAEAQARAKQWQEEHWYFHSAKE
jgi:TPR repeat protein